MKSPYLLLPLILFTLFSVTSCDPSTLFGPKAGNTDQYNLRVSYHRGSCYGRCEVYTLNLYDNGLLLFQGERFTERPGTWQKNIDRRRVVALIDSFQRADFPNYPRSFRGQIPDAATVSFTYYDPEGIAYQTSFKDFAPKELQDLDQAMIKLSQLPDYRQVSETIADKIAAPVGNREREEIIVQLKDGVVAESWIVAYGKQNVKIKNRISPTSPYYVITADPNIMGGAELLEFLRKDESVVSAQLNKQVSPR
jgi:hypothetical protein